MGAAGAALTFTLPDATGSGNRFEFVVSVVNTSNYIIATAASDKISGSLIVDGDEANDVATSFSANAADTITLNGTTTGGVSIGDRIVLLDIAANVWAVSGQVTESGVEATMFS
jgi:hypothetical protein